MREVNIALQVVPVMEEATVFMRKDHLRPNCKNISDNVRVSKILMQTFKVSDIMLKRILLLQTLFWHYKCLLLVSYIHLIRAPLRK